MQNLPSLPQEVIDDILYRLPAKTIGRCRCVSNSWLDQLTQPHFIKTHLKQSLKQPTQSLFLISDTGALFSVPLRSAHPLFDQISSCATKLNFPNKTDHWDKVIASCDELVLVSCNRGEMWIINPTTRVIRDLPPSPVESCTSLISMFGMGYDKVRDDYKVVNFLSFPMTFVSVFSVKSGAWRMANNSPYDNCLVGLTSWVLVEGCFHSFALEDTGCKITAFNVSDENFYEVPSPSSLAGNFALEYVLGVLGGCLCLSYSALGKEKIDFWVMKEYGVKESWTEFTIANPERTVCRPLILFGEEELQVVLVKDKKLVMYDMKEKTVKDIMVHGVPFASVRCCVTFTESLVSPNWYHEAVTDKKISCCYLVEHTLRSLCDLVGGIMTCQNMVRTDA